MAKSILRINSSKKLGNKPDETLRHCLLLFGQDGIHAGHKRHYKVTTDSKHNLPVAQNLLDRDFNPAAPNQVWTSDITYLWTDEGWLYLAIVLDSGG